MLIWSPSQFRVVAPMGKKLCECGKSMSSADRHARCQTCRNSAPHLAAKYAKECPACARPFVADRARSIACSLSCAQKYGQKAKGYVG